MRVPHSKAFEHRDDESFTGDNHDSLVTVVPVLETKADVNFTEVGDIAITLTNETFEGLKRVVALECELRIVDMNRNEAHVPRGAMIEQARIISSANVA